MEQLDSASPELPKELLDNNYARKKLNTLGERFAQEIQALPSIKDFNINLTSFLNDIPKDNFELASVKVKELLLKLLSNIKKGNEETLSAISEKISSAPPLTDDLLHWVDTILVSVAKDETLDTQTKYKFFEEVNKTSEGNFIAFATESSFDEAGNPIPSTFTPPINYFYVINPDMAKLKIERLRYMKSYIKQLEEQYTETTLLGPTAIETQTDQSDELYNLLVHTDKTYNHTEVALAFLQLLKIYREFINTLLAGSNDSYEVLTEQNDEKPTNALREGNEYNEKRRINTRRIANFLYMHVGEVPAKDLNPDLNKIVDPTNETENTIAINKQLVESSMSDADIPIEVMDIYEMLTPEVQQKLEELKKIKNLYISEKNNTLTQIAEQTLSALDVLSPPELAQQQIDAKEKGSGAIPTSTYAVYRKKGNGAMSRDGKYKIFTIQDERGGSLMEVFSKIAHETGHMLQGYAADNSLLPGLGITPNLGRHDITAESGAIKLEAMCLKLFGESREVNKYHFQMTQELINGKSFSEIFSLLVREINKLPDIQTITDPKSREEEVIKRAYRSIKRLYDRLGAMGDTNQTPRFPTNLNQLDYINQGLPPYSYRNYYETAIPVQRTDLVRFLRAPTINGEKIDEVKIISSVINSTYNVAKEQNLLAA